MAERSETERIREALDSGRLFVTDETGYRRFIYACCPQDGNDSSVRRQEKSGQALMRLLFRCPICQAEFESPIESLFLR